MHYSNPNKHIQLQSIEEAPCPESIMCVFMWYSKRQNKGNRPNQNKKAGIKRVWVGGARQHPSSLGNLSTCSRTCSVRPIFNLSHIHEIHYERTEGRTKTHGY